MSVIVNDLTIEPKTTPPKEAAPSDDKPVARSGPELEREFDRLRRRQIERAVRLWAH